MAIRPRHCEDAARSGGEPRETHPRFAVVAALQQGESLRQYIGGRAALLHHDERAWTEPAPLGAGFERARREIAAIGGIAEDQIGRGELVGGTEPRRIAPEQAGDAPEPERLDILANQPARLGAVIDEERECRTARERLKTKRPGPGEQIDHPRTRAGIVMAMGEDVEDRLAQAVGSRADRAGFARPGLRSDDSPSAETPAHDAHDGSAPRRLVRPLAGTASGRAGRPPLRFATGLAER